MNKVATTNATEETIGLSVGKDDRSINIRTQHKVLHTLDHSSRPNLRLFRSLFSDTIFIAVLISGLFFGLIQESTASPLIASREDVTTTYSGAWTANSSKFSRDLNQLAKHFYYQAIEVSVSTMGIYTFTSRSTINTYGYIYKDKFDSDDPTLNLISQDDDSDGKEQFKITTVLHDDHRYILVATTNRPEVIGEFLIISSGPTTVNIRSKIESRTISNRAAIDSTTPYTSIYSSALSSSSQVFHRPDGDTDDYYYLQAIQVTVSTAGTYIFMSDSNIDTIGYFYNSPFDPSNPVANLITEDDDDGDGDFQFRIEVYLVSGRTYILVVTTHREYVMGNFAVSARGPASAVLTSITASTSRPIVTHPTVPTMSSSYSGALLSSSQVFYRPDGDTDDYYYFQAIQVSVSTAGTYIFMSDSNMDTIGYFYNSPFDPSNPVANLITEDDDDGDGIFQFRIEVYLASGQTYILVVTTHLQSVTGNFAVSASGPASVILVSITPATSQPITTLSTAPAMSSSYSGALLSSSQVFNRPGGNKNNYYYFQAIQVSVSTAGTYIFMSASSMDTVGYFYNSPFDPSNPLANLITEDDDDGDGDFQFRIAIDLESGRTYVLVVTTHSESLTGNFAVSARGPTSAGLTSIIASTSRPVITQPTTPSVPSSYAGALSSSSPMFFRPGDNTQRQFYYRAIQVTVSTAGRYIFTSNSRFDTWGYFYQTSFDPSDPTMNLVTDDDDGAPQLQFRIQVYLQSGRTYVLVVTTHREFTTGNFSVAAVGPASVGLISITPSTSRPIITPSTTPPKSSWYPGVLSSSSPIFYRPQSLTNNYHYFQAIQITVPTAGSYIFKSNSTIDTRGYFYRTSFDPSNATANLIADNDDGGGNLQFRIEIDLEPGQIYVLVVTTHREYVTGNFSVSAVGQAIASLTSITPSTSRPITAQSTTPSISSWYPGALTSSSPIFYRPQSLTTNYHYFQAIQVTVPTAGNYIFKSNSTIDTRGYFYRTAFDPSNATANLVTDNDDGGGSLQFRIEVYLEPGQIYVLVVTTHREYVTGNFSVSAGGPAIASLTSITPSTSRPITTQATTSSMSSSYVGALTSSGQSFSRPGDVTQRQFYFQAIQVTVHTTGSYIFQSNSTIDTRGYFYRTSFNPYNSTVNLIAENDDGGGNLQFRIQVYLESGQTYILVVTTHRENVTGSFSVSVAGPAIVNLMFIIASTIPPTTTTTTAPFLSSTYMGVLSPTSPVFYRPHGDRKDYYYQAIQVTVSNGGTYSFTSNSYFDTVGYLYDTSFDPFNPLTNLITYDDNGGTDTEFLINFALQSGRKYILVVTTSQASALGVFWVSARGLDWADLTLILPPTGTTTNDPSLSTQTASRTTVKSSASITTSAITTTTVCMLILLTLQMFQQRLF